MSWVARKPMVLLSVKYRPRDIVPLDRLAIDPALRRRLIEQRRVVPHVVESTADVQIVEPATPSIGDVAELRGVLNADGSIEVGQSVNGAPETTATSTVVQEIRCKAENVTNGNRCKQDATGDGLCKIHRNALARRASNESTEG